MSNYFDHLDDNLDDLINSPAKPATKQAPAHYKPNYFERCAKCGGSGRYRGFGTCYACQGKGGKGFKTAPAVRAAARDKAAERRAALAASLAEETATFKAQHEDEMAWLQATARRVEERGTDFGFP